MLLITVVSLLVLLVSGVPITFSLLASGFIGVAVTNSFPLYINCQRFISGINSFSLMAVPLFVVGGAIMNESGISSRIVNFCSALLSWMRGGLGCICVAANMIFGGISGSGTAAISAIGSITAPAMVKTGYSKNFVAALIGGAGSTAPIIPPSCDMIVFASITGLSISKMFIGGFVPGITIGLILMVVCYLYAKKHNIDYGGRFMPSRVWEAAKEAVWALLMPVIIIGSVTFGICTATEAGAVACVYGLFVGKFIYKELTLKGLLNVFKNATVTNGQIMTLFAASTLYGYIFTLEGVGDALRSFLVSITDNPTVIMLLTAGLMLVIGCFMESVAAMPIVLPIVYPLLESMGCNMVQFGVMFCMCTIIGGLTPPVGCYLFVASSVVKEKVTRVIPWMMLMVAIDVSVMLLVALWEPFATFLPSLLG